MLKRNDVVIADEKSKEFKEMTIKYAKNKQFWKQNREYLQSHKVDLSQLEDLYKQS